MVASALVLMSSIFLFSNERTLIQSFNGQLAQLHFLRIHDIALCNVLETVHKQKILWRDLINGTEQDETIDAYNVHYRYALKDPEQRGTNTALLIQVIVTVKNQNSSNDRTYHFLITKEPKNNAAKKGPSDT